MHVDMHPDVHPCMCPMLLCIYVHAWMDHPMCIHALGMCPCAAYASTHRCIDACMYVSCVCRAIRNVWRHRCYSRVPTESLWIDRCNDHRIARANAFSILNPKSRTRLDDNIMYVHAYELPCIIGYRCSTAHIWKPLGSSSISTVF